MLNTRSFLWILFRVLFVAVFAYSFATTPSGIGAYPLDAGTALFLPLALFFAAWRISSILRHRYEKRKVNDDWTASLWSSPILRNPESFWIIGALSFILGALLGFMLTTPRARMLGWQATILAFGFGVLCGWAIFRFKFKHRRELSPGKMPS